MHYVKDPIDSIWKETKTPYTKIGITWTIPKAMFINHLGTWKQVWPGPTTGDSTPPPDPTPNGGVHLDEFSTINAFAALGSGVTTAYAAISLDNDGYLRVTSNSNTDVWGRWLNEGLNAADYSAYLVKISDSGAVFTIPYGSWINLGAGATWSVSLGAKRESKYANFYIQIRKDSDPSVLLSNTKASIEAENPYDVTPGTRFDI